MREIELKVKTAEVELPNTRLQPDGTPIVQTVPFSYRQAILTILAGPLNFDPQTGQPRGVGIDDIRRIDTIFGLFEDAKDGDIVSLDDQQYTTVMQMVRDFRFGSYNKFVVPLVEDLENAPEPVATKQKAITTLCAEK